MLRQAWDVRPVALLLASLLIVPAAACSDVEDHLADGEIHDACRRARTHYEKEGPYFEAWLMDNAQVVATPVPHDEIAETLGAPVLGYGETLALYELAATVPRGVVEIESPPASGAASLVARMPPIVKLSRAPKLAHVSRAELRPDLRRRRVKRGSDPFSAIFDAVGAIGMGVGIAVGAAVAVPVGLVVGLAQGIGGILDAIFGGGGKRGPPEDTYAPVQVVEPADQASVDSVLESGSGRVNQQIKIAEEYQQHLEAVRTERERRVALATDPDLLDASPTRCATGDCRVVFSEVPPLARVQLHFLADGARPPVDASGRFAPPRGACRWGMRVPIDVVAPEVPPEPPTPTVTVPGVTPLVTLMQPDLPAFALDHPVQAKRGARPAKVRAAKHVDDLYCRVRSRRGRADLYLRVAAGTARTRVFSGLLARRTRAASFVLHDVGLARDESLRLQLATGEGRSFGGDIVEFDGRLPLRFRNAAFTATCSAVELDAAETARRRKRATDAVAAALAGDEDADPSEEELVHRAELVEEAERRVVALAALTGWRDEATKRLAEDLLR